jgi:membrane-anchored mycosin MYCP
VLTRLPLVVAGALVGAAVATASAGPAHAEPDADCSSYDEDSQPGTVTSASRPLSLMHIGEVNALFKRAGKVPGEGVTVAVVDNGVVDSDYLRKAPGHGFDGAGAVVDYHGTAVAGLIAGGTGSHGPIGIAPGATIVDVRVYDTDEPTDESQVRIESSNVVEGLQWVADAARTDRSIKVVNVSLALGDSPALKKVIRELVQRDVVVVAASGNRPKADVDYGYGDFDTKPVDGHGEDAAQTFFPAGYPDVLTVNATAGGLPNSDDVDVREFVLQNSRTDVAAPTYDGVSLDISPGGGLCRLNASVATSWATAEVSGVVAMLRSWYVDDTAQQIVARLKATANGTDSDSEQMMSRLTGAGVVQPLEALTRPMTVTRSGAVVAAVDEVSQLPPASAPSPEADPLGSMRDNAVWWGLLSGGLIVLALLMRPIIIRLRR